MMALESFFLSYLANAVWQVALLWAAGWSAARVLRRLGALAEHRVWVAVLLLQVLLPACSAVRWVAFRALFLWALPAARDGQPHVSVVMGAGTAWTGLHLPAWALAGIAIGYGGATAYFAARFAWRWRQMCALRSSAVVATLSGNAALWWERCSRTFGVTGASLATSSSIYGPATLGISRRLMLLPASMVSSLAEGEMCAAISHEFAHMRRHDFLKNLAYEALSIPIAFHPFLRLTSERITETREMVCDRMAADAGEPHQYARSLLRLASLLVEGVSTNNCHAIGIFDATTFERRVMKLTEKQATTSMRRRLATVAICALLGAGVCTSALAFGVHVDALAAGDEHKPSSPNEPVKVRPDVMQNQIVRKVNPVYPVDAKKARIQGIVKLDAVIGTTGEVEQLKVISGPDQLQKSALDAVRQWTYKPFLLNGDPVEVKTTITVTYTLSK